MEVLCLDYRNSTGFVPFIFSGYTRYAVWLVEVIWRCNGKYEVKGKKGCSSRHIDDGVLYQAFVDVFNLMLENKDYFIEKWRERLISVNVLVRYKAKQFIEVLAASKGIDKFDVSR